MLLRRVPLWSRLVLSRGSAYPNSVGKKTAVIRTLTVWEPDRQSGFRTVRQATSTWRDVYSIDNVKRSIKDLKKQFRLWRNEWKEYWVNAQEALEPDDVKMIFDFRDPDREKLEGWVVTADADYLHGRSWGKMELTQEQTCLFTGNLDHTPIPDGWSVHAGYVNLRSPFKLKSFRREDAYNWTSFTHLIIRCRGDGRNYLINLNTRGFFDVTWNDLYSYPLYTRGGPYWQTERIPFSKFFFAHKGKIQDNQSKIDLMNVHNISFTAGDGIDGPFSLEIDYIAIEIDIYHKEEFAYELYEGRRYEN